ncbi:FMN-dependent NADH-azoreductase, partial [Rhizobium phaseoli]
MSSILLLTSSPRAESLSTPIAVDLAEKLKNQNPGSVVVRR